jgi:hypothetical protein
MIPEFTDTGFLPEGMHLASIEEFENRFAQFNRSDRRIRLFEKLDKLIADAKASSIVRRVIVAGSFVTAKAEPNDFDCILILEFSVLSKSLSASEYNLVSRRAARRIYAGDVVAVLPGSEQYFQYLDFFQTNRDGEKVGVVEINL